MSKTNQSNTNSDKQLQHLASLLKELRVNENLSQDEVARELKIHRNTIYRIESGKPFSTLLLLKIACFYNINLSELFTDLPQK
ncbi:MAG: helix-turn-helix transcriptional regulator [bacterium]